MQKIFCKSLRACQNDNQVQILRKQRENKGGFVMNEQFETQNPVENTVTSANQMETPTPEAPKKKGNKISIIAGVAAEWLSRAALAYLRWSKQELFKPIKRYCLRVQRLWSDMGSLGETLKDCVSLYSDEYTLKMDLSMNEGRYFHGGAVRMSRSRQKGNLNISVHHRLIFSRHWCGQCAGGSPDNQ